MPILTIRHVTTYHYRQPVAFGEHRMMLHPRDDGDQKVLESELVITPEPSQLSWTRDSHGNHVATAHFADQASELRFESKFHLDHAPADFRAPDIADFACTYPFAYPAEDGHGLVRDLLFGQTVDRVRHNLEIPMLIARPGRGWSHASASTPNLAAFAGETSPSSAGAAGGWKASD